MEMTCAIAPDLCFCRGGVDSVSVLGLGLVDPRGLEVVPERHIRAQRGGADDAGQHKTIGVKQ